MVNNISDNTDLHHNALQASRLNKLSALHDSINFIINDIAAKYGKDCVLTYDDTISLLLRTENFKNYLEWIREFDKSFRYQVDDSGFALACRKYLVCFESGFNNMTNISQENMDRCISDTEKMFVGAYAYYQSKNLIWDYSFGDEVFMNGSVQDSPFDIYYDIEQIHKILYANPTRIPNYYLWRPLSYEDNQGMTSKDTFLADGNAPIGLIPVDIYASSDPIGMMDIKDAINQIRSTEWSSEVVSNLQCLTGVNTANQIPIADQVKKEIEKIKWDIVSFQEEQVIDNFVTEILPSIDPTIWIMYDKPLVIGDKPGDNIVDNEESNTDPNPDNVDPLEPNTCPINTYDLQRQFNINSDNPNIVWCIKACQDGCGDKKTALTKNRLACYQSCLCSRYAKDIEFMDGRLGSTEFGIRFCTVPSSTTDIITPGRQVLSIQEVIDGINNITAKLKESWQVIPSSKKKEFFSPTVNVKNLVNVFNFTVNIVKKQDYRKPLIDDAKKQVQQDIFNRENLDVTKQQIRGVNDKQTFISDFLILQDTFWTQVSEVIDDRYSQISNVK